MQAMLILTNITAIGQGASLAKSQVLRHDLVRWTDVVVVAADAMRGGDYEEAHPIIPMTSRDSLAF